MTAIAVAVIAISCSPATAGTRPVQERIDWLAGRVAHHRYVCRHGKHQAKRFSCRALGWAARELREAKAELEAREWAAPPEPWLSLARCEQRGHGPHGVTWDAWSESYEGAYGFTHAAWRQWRLRWMPAHANQASPRVQTMVARRIQRDVGWGAWPACHIRLGLH